uniref:Uncharacterized protein n=1 Tax=Physcomitrium patens TaxID=3218 RepID=A0A2K1J7H5_PHYPA|nr:hypothetical protein PHYPA_020585 [Physcomitrium patens]
MIWPVAAAGFLVEAGKTAWDASTNLIPESVPRGVARITVGVVGVSLIIHALRAFFSTALFIMFCRFCQRWVSILHDSRSKAVSQIQARNRENPGTTSTEPKADGGHNHHPGVSS